MSMCPMAYAILLLYSKILFLHRLYTYYIFTIAHNDFLFTPIQQSWFVLSIYMCIYFRVE
jgi:hypothetical protein